MNDRIVVAVDGSASSFKALDFAADLACRHESRVVLVHVVPEGGLPQGLRHWAELEHVEGDSAWLYEQAVAERILGAAAERLRGNGVTRVERIAAHGEPAKRIIEVAAEEAADVIVLGTRGLSDLQGLLMGSVAHKVTHAAPCTVVTVR